MAWVLIVVGLGIFAYGLWHWGRDLRRRPRRAAGQTGEGPFRRLVGILIVVVGAAIALLGAGLVYDGLYRDQPLAGAGDATPPPAPAAESPGTGD